MTMTRLNLIEVKWNSAWEQRLWSLTYRKNDFMEFRLLNSEPLVPEGTHNWWI